MEYLKEVIWYLTLPMTVWLAYRFVLINLKEFEKIEQKSEPATVIE